MNWFERGWYKQHKGTYWLMPLSLIFWLLSALRRKLFKLGLKKTTRVKLPVIVVGNITVGGTGKTPFVIWLIEFLQQQGWQPGVISRGYGSQIKHGLHLVQANDPACLIGDEVKLIHNRTQVPIVVGVKRVDAAAKLAELGQCNIIISDDGLQHYALNRDIEIILIDAQRQLGNQLLLPAGPLREGAWRLKTTPFVIYNGLSNNELSNEKTHFHFTTQVQSAQPVVPNLKQPPNTFDSTKSYCAICGIGNPQRFWDTLDKVNISVADKRVFLDHYQYTATDFETLKTPVIMTEKDAVKCTLFAQPDWWYLPISISPCSEFVNKLSSQLVKLNN